MYRINEKEVKSGAKYSSLNNLNQSISENLNQSIASISSSVTKKRLRPKTTTLEDALRLGKRDKLFILDGRWNYWEILERTDLTDEVLAKKAIISVDKAKTRKFIRRKKDSSFSQEKSFSSFMDVSRSSNISYSNF